MCRTIHHRNLSNAILCSHLFIPLHLIHSQARVKCGFQFGIAFCHTSAITLSVVVEAAAAAATAVLICLSIIFFFIRYLQMFCVFVCCVVAKRMNHVTGRSSDAAKKHESI